MYKFLIPFLFLCQGIQAQDRINSAGGEATGVTGHISYSIGLVDYLNLHNSTASISEGLQIPYEIYPVSINELEGAFNVNLYPNPVASHLSIDIPAYLGTVTLQIHDVTGNLIVEKVVSHMHEEIDLSTLANSTYILTILSHNQKSQSYQIIKTQ